jgi:hypothetical protein
VERSISRVAWYRFSLVTANVVAALPGRSAAPTPPALVLGAE